MEPCETAEYPRRMSLLNYITTELSRGYLMERDEAKYSEKRERVYIFMKVPRALERFLLYGFAQCADAFLFLFTFLPLRICLALLRLLTHPCGVVMHGSKRILEQAQICDLLKGVVILSASCILNYIDTSMVYHLIRAQAVIKLYIFFNMLELADKLFSTFGQDILDALFWTATEPLNRKRERVGVIPHLLLAIIYVFIHTMLFLFQVTTLSVAFNSHNKALLIIMMSNNFVEIKTNVFRRMDKNNLFQMTCHDAKERFHYIILLFLVFIRNMTEFSWDPDHFWLLLPDAVLVLFAEVLVDWFKHAFVTKFNEISSDVYHEFTVSLAYDMSATRQKFAFSDHSDLVSRRMSFTPLPLTCLVISVCWKSLRIGGYMGIAIAILSYFVLLTLKILTSIILLGTACDLIRQHKNTFETELKSPEPTQPSSPTPIHISTPLKTQRSNSEPQISTELSKTTDVLYNIEKQPLLSQTPVLSSSSVSITSLMLHEDFQDKDAQFEESFEEREKLLTSRSVEDLPSVVNTTLTGQSDNCEVLITHTATGDTDTIHSDMEVTPAHMDVGNCDNDGDAVRQRHGFKSDLGDDVREPS